MDAFRSKAMHFEPFMVWASSTYKVFSMQVCMIHQNNNISFDFPTCCTPMYYFYIFHREDKYYITF